MAKELLSIVVGGGITPIAREKFVAINGAAVCYILSENFTIGTIIVVPSSDPSESGFLDEKLKFCCLPSGDVAALSQNLREISLENITYGMYNTNRVDKSQFQANPISSLRCSVNAF